MPLWCNHHTIILTFAIIVWTIDGVYCQLSSRNPILAELKELQSKQWHILYHMTSVGCAFSTARHVGSRVGSCVAKLHSLANPKTNQCISRWMRSEPSKWCMTHMQCPEWYPFLPEVLNLLLRHLMHEVPCGCARWFLGRLLSVNQQNGGYESKLTYLTSCTKEPEQIIPVFLSTPFSLFLRPWTHRHLRELSQQYVTCTKQPLSIQNLPD